MFMPKVYERLHSEIYELVDYIQLKIKQRDWHAISDAANDIRELEAKIELIKLIDAGQNND